MNKKLLFPNFLKNFLIALITLATGLILVEFALTRLFPAFNPANKFIYYRNAEGVPLGPKNFSGRLLDNSGDFNVPVVINHYGFRDIKDLAQSKAQDLFVVVDSFSFGYGVEEDKRYSSQIQTMLGVQVYNIAIPGDIEDYCLLLDYAQRHGAVIKNLIVGICMENDLGDYSGKKVRAYKISEKKRSWIESLKNFLDIHSTIYNICAYTAHGNRFLKNLAIKFVLINRSEEMINKTIYNKLIIESSIQKLKEITKPFNTTILIIPSRALWIGEQQETESLIHNEFIRELKAAGMKIIDMWPYFEEGGNPIQYHFPHNGHWNEKGHHLAAEVLSEYFRNNTELVSFRGDFRHDVK